MMIRKLLLLLLLSIYASIVYGQNNDTKQQINKIKKSSAYISAEATLPDEEEAFKVANELLDNEVKEWVSARQKGKTAQRIVLRDLNSFTQTINMKRGDNVRAFVYVKKTNIIPLNEQDEIILNPEEKTELTELPEMDEIEKISNALQAEKEVQTQNVPTSTHSMKDALDDIKNVKTMSEMKELFSRLKDGERIVYDTYPTENLNSSFYLLFYTRSGEIMGVVSAKEGRYVDLNSGQDVKLSSFSGCGAYWFELK